MFFFIEMNEHSIWCDGISIIPGFSIDRCLLMWQKKFHVWNNESSIKNFFQFSLAIVTVINDEWLKLNGTMFLIEIELLAVILKFPNSKRWHFFPQLKPWVPFLSFPFFFFFSFFSFFCWKMNFPFSTNNTWFERISMMAILLNCVTLGMYQPCADDETCTTSRCKILQTFDDIIFGFFALEMVIKMLAMGIMNAPNSYLSDTWNRLDFFIVVAGYVLIVFHLFNNPHYHLYSYEQSSWVLSGCWQYESIGYPYSTSITAITSNQPNTK